MIPREILKAFALILPFIFQCPAFAKNFGLGVVVGAPTGLTAKYWQNETHAIDGTLAWSMRSQHSIDIQSAYLHHKNGAFHIQALPIGFYYGLGGYLSSTNDKKNSNLELGLRAPLGINHILRDPEVEFFSELAPHFQIISSTQFFLTLGIGARFYF